MDENDTLDYFGFRYNDINDESRKNSISTEINLFTQNESNIHNNINFTDILNYNEPSKFFNPKIYSVNFPKLSNVSSSFRNSNIFHLIFFKIL